VQTQPVAQPKAPGSAKKGTAGKGSGAKSKQESARTKTASPRANDKQVSVQTVQKKAPRRGIRLKMDDETGDDDL
jgi:hypothetical protein